MTDRRKDNREDVADQNGWGPSLLGLFFAILIGILFRTAFSKDLITEQVRKAAEKVHQGVLIEFDSADLSLSDGPFPEFAIVVERVRFASNETCWLSPAAEADELRLPLNPWGLLFGRVEIQEVKLGQVTLLLRTPMSDCERSKEIKNVESVVAPATDEASITTITSVSVAEPPFLSPPDSRGPITRISVHSLQVQYLPVPFTGFEIDRLTIDRYSESPLSIRTSGELNLGGATLSGDYSSRARFEIDYGHPSVKAKLTGTWREGSYHLNLTSDIEKQMIALDGSIDHLPLSQILPFLKKYNVIKGDYDGRQVWLNLKFKSPAPAAWADGVPIDVERLTLEGDLGQIEGGGFHIRRWSPIEFSNTEISLRGLQIEKLLRLFGQTEKPKSLGALGELNGIVKLEGARRFQLSGEYSGLELIFSNRGERKSQIMSLITGNLNFDQGRWKLNIDRVRPFEGLFLGSAVIEGNEDEQTIRASLHVDEMHLGPEIQNLMSGGGSLGRWAGDLDGRWYQGQLVNARGQILAQDILIDGVGLSRLRASFGSVSGVGSGANNREVIRQHMLIDLRGSDLEVSEGSPVRKVLDPLAVAVGKEGAKVWKTEQFQAAFDFKLNESLQWKLRPLQFAGWQVRSDGSWSEKENLKGLVFVRGNGKQAESSELKWRIEGDRDAPVFIEEK